MTRGRGGSGAEVSVNRMSGDRLVIIANWWHIAFVSPFATIYA